MDQIPLPRFWKPFAAGVILACSLFLPPVFGQTQGNVRVLFDIGDWNTSNRTPSPTTNGVYWNNVTNNASPGSTIISNAISSAGALTGIRLMFQQNNFNNIAPGCGTTTNPAYPATATRDAFMLQDSNRVVILNFSGLPTNQPCSFKFLGSHVQPFATNSAMTFGIGSVTQTMVTYMNSTNTLVLSGTADTGGVVRVSVRSYPRPGVPLPCYAVLNVLEINYGTNGAPPETVVRPELDPMFGTYTGSVYVTVACATTGAMIRYTLGVTAPTTNSMLYTDPIQITTSTALLVRAFKDGLLPSSVATGSYTIVSAPPPPGLAVSPGSIECAMQVEQNATNQIEVWSDNGEFLSYTVTVGQAWLSVDPASGSSTGNHSVVAVTCLGADLTAGVYTGVVTVASAEATNSPQQVAVTLTVTNAVVVRPALAASLTNLSFSTYSGGATSLSLRVWNKVSGTAMGYSLSSATGWLTVDPPSGSSTGEQDTITIAPDITGLATGSYSGTLVIDSAEATNAPLSLPVTLKVTLPPVLGLSTNKLAISGIVGTSNAVSVSLSVRNTGGGSMTYSIAENTPWQWCSPTSGVNNTGQWSMVWFYASASNLPAGVYTSLVAFSSAQATNSPLTVPLVFTVHPQPGLVVAPAVLNAFVKPGSNAAPQAIAVRNGNPPAQMTFMVSPTNTPWLTVSPPSNWSTGQDFYVTVNFASSNLAAGVYTGLVAVTAPSASNSPQTVVVNLTVTNSFGTVATPVLFPSGGTFTTTVWVAMSCATTGATIRYTLNAGDPTPASILYTGPVAIATSTTVRARAFKEDMQQSAMAYGPFTILRDPVLYVYPASVTRSVSYGYTATGDTFQVRNSGIGAMAYTVSSDAGWVSAVPSSGSSAGETDWISLVYNTAGLASGSYTGIVTVTAAGVSGSPKTVVIRLTVQPPPVLWTSPEILAQAVPRGGSATGQLFRVRNSGSGSMAFGVTTDVAWAWANPASGTSTGETKSIWVNYQGIAEMTSGVYTGHAFVNAALATNPLRVVTLELTVLPGARLGVSPALLENAVAVGSEAAAQTVEVRNDGAGAMDYTVEAGSSWLSVSPAAGSSSGEVDTITVAYHTAGLSSGLYTGSVTVCASGAEESPRSIPVILSVTGVAPVLMASVSNLAFTVFEGANTEPAEFQVWNAVSGSALPFAVSGSVSWLVVNPASGVCTGALETVTVMPETIAFEPGIQTGTIVIAAADAANSPLVLPVTVTVIAAPAIEVHTNRLDFSVAAGGSDSRLILVRNTASGVIWVSAYSSVPWLQVPQAVRRVGSVYASFVISVNSAGLAAGVTTASVTFVSAQATNSTQEVTVELTVRPAPTLQVAPAQLVNTAQQGCEATSQWFVVRNTTPPDPMPFTVTPSASWLAVTPASGSDSGSSPQTVRLDYLCSGLPAGVHSGAVVVASSSAANPSVTVPVVLTIQAADAVIAASPQVLSARVTAGSGAVVESGVDVWNAGGSGAMSYTLTPDVAWLAVAPASGVSTGAHNLHLVAFSNTASLAAGVYTGHLAIASGQAGNSPGSVGVVLTVDPAPAALAASPASQSLTLSQGDPDAERTFEVWNGGGAEPMPFTLQSTAGWLTAVPASGCSSGDHVAVTCRVSSANLAAGSYDGAILVLAASATNSPLPLGIHVTVNPQPALIAASPTALAATLVAGGSVATQQLWVWNAGTGVMSYALSVDSDWLSVEPPTGVVVGAQHRLHPVLCGSIGLDEGTHTGLVSIAGEGAANTPYGVPVVLQVLPALSASPASLAFAAEASNPPPAQVLQVWNAGSANPVAYTVSAGAAWLTLDPADGSSAGEVDAITVGCESTGLAPGLYHSYVEVAPAGVPAAARRIPVQLTVRQGGAAFQERIVFAAYVSGDWNIWSCTPDGSNLTPVVVKSGQQLHPRVSPDGLKLAYRDMSLPQPRLLVRELATGAETALPALWPYDWTPDSLSIIGTTNAVTGNDLLKAGLDGSLARLFTEPDRQTPMGVDPGSGRVYYTTDPGITTLADLRVFDPATSNRATILPRDGRYRAPGNVSRDGRLLVYPRSGTGTTGGVYVCGTDGLGERLIGCAPSSGDRNPHFSPAGDQVVFTRTNSLYRGPVSGPALPPTGVYTGISDYASWCVMLVPTAAPPRIVTLPSVFYPSCTIGSNAFYQMLRVYNGGGGALTFSVASDVPWIVPTPSAGISANSNNWIYVRLDFYTAGLALGGHTGRVTVTSSGAVNTPWVVPVSLTVKPPAAVVDCSPGALSNSCVAGYDADSQTLQIRNAGGGVMTYTLSTNAAWLSVSPVSGSSTGETDTITVSYRTAGYSTDLAGTVTVTAAGAVYSPRKIPVTVRVLAPPPADPPVLSVTPLALSNSTPAGAQAPRQAIGVQNTGGGTLAYTLTDNADWLTVSPTSGASVGETDWLDLEYNTASLTTGLYTAEVTVSTAVGDQTVTVLLAVSPAPTYWLSIVTNPPAGGWIAATPAPGAGGRYVKGTVVTLTANPAVDYTFDCWLGPVISTSRWIAVRLDTNTVETAVFRRRTGLSGVVSNAVTGGPVRNALVTFGTNAALTGVSGAYAFRDVGTMTDTIRVSRAGYQTWEESLTPAAFTATTKSFALTPAFVSNVRAVQRPGTKLVDITYDFDTLAGDSPVVSLVLSSGGGSAWDIVPRTVTGDMGTNVAPGLGRRIVWNAGVDWPGMLSSSMVAQVSAGGSAARSALFPVTTRDSGLGRVRAWADKNRNGLCDANEALGGVEIYYDGRTAVNRIGVTASDGYLTINRPIQAGRTLFGRKRIDARPAVKGGHAAVSNLMYTLWMDSDVGGTDASVWDGTWRSYAVTPADAAGVESGAPILLKLGHPLFQWHLLVASEIGSPAFVSQLKQGLSLASTLLYDATDGQMKFGAVSIAAGGAAYSNAMRQADIVVRGYSGMYMGFYPFGIQSTYGSISAGSTFWNGAPPATAVYAQGLVRAFFSYAMGIMPEFASGAGNRIAWAQYRAQHPDEVPSSYGLMDEGVDASELSSVNKYLPYYTPRTNAFKVTMQIWRYDLSMGRGAVPAWQHLERQFQRYYAGGIWAEIVTPQPGVYQGYNRFSSDDRPGPFFLPAPYVPCAFTDDPGGIPPGVFLAPLPGPGLSAPASPAPAALRVFVERDGARVPGAEVLHRPADPEARITALGRTDAAGSLLVYDLAADDLLEVAWRGLRATYKAASIDRWCDSLVIALPASPPSPNAFTGPSRSSLFAPVEAPQADPPGLIVSGALIAAPHSLEVRIRADRELAEAPSVLADLDDGSSAMVALGAAGANVYTGVVELGEALGGTLDIQADAAGGGSASAIAAFEITATSTNAAVSLRSRSGRVELALDPENLPAETEGVIYEGDLPPIIPDGFTPAHPVGAPAFVGLADGQTWTGEAALTMTYEDADVAGLDERTVALFAWDESTTHWLAVPSTRSLEQNRITAGVTAPGVYALFADPAPDTEAPAAIEDLVASDGTNGWTVALAWTAVGDDDRTGTAAAYRIRYATAPITNWDEATAVSVALTPAESGAPESVELRMPDPNTLYYFAVKAVDEAGNAGGISVIAAARSQFEDADGDGVPDQTVTSTGGGEDLDADGDGDGLTLREELDARTDPARWDTDGDGMNDGWELAHGLNPLSADDLAGDGDGDAVSNRQEYDAGADPENADSDADGIPDGWELEKGLNPISGSGVNGAEADPDEDGFANPQEYIADTDPFNPASRLVITGARVETDGFHLDFDSSARRQYDFLRSTNLVTGGWEAIDSDRWGLGGPTTVIDSDATNRVQFYRIRVHQP